MNIHKYMLEVGQQAVQAKASIAMASTEQKNLALLKIAHCLEKQNEGILQANAKDMAAAKQNNLSAALLDRLELTPVRIQAMIEGCHQVAKLADPVGLISEFNNRPSGINVAKMRVPLGVVGMIYESRPNVTVDAAILCLKSGNAVVLRGGSEAIHSNLVLAQCLNMGLTEANLDPLCVQVIKITDRKLVTNLVTLSDCIDIIIPRGGRRLIERISREATVPVIKHLDGVCHVYIDQDADIVKAIDVAFNAKTRRYGVCGAMETLLISEKIADQVLPTLAQRYLEKGIELRGCAQSQALVCDMTAATEEDWYTEYLEAILSIRIVQDIYQAMQHIETYGSHHTDCIITENEQHANLFLRQVDSSSVMLNASTQFADGFQYGLGAEIGISTDKLHVRGPVGLEGLTSQKYIVKGNGHILA